MFSDHLVNSVFLTAIQFSEDTMEKAVTLMTQLNSLVTQCDGYVQGRFDCPDILQSELYAKWAAVYNCDDITETVVVGLFCCCWNLCSVKLKVCRRFVSVLIAKITHYTFSDFDFTAGVILCLLLHQKFQCWCFSSGTVSSCSFKFCEITIC